MLAILNSLNAHNLPIFQPILIILVSKFIDHRALFDETYLSFGLLSPLNIPWKFHFHRIFKNRGFEGEPPEPLWICHWGKLEPLFEKEGFYGFDMWSVRTACDIKGDGRRLATGKA